jgi:hypothetical protein
VVETTDLGASIRWVNCKVGGSSLNKTYKTKKISKKKTGKEKIEGNKERGKKEVIILCQEESPEQSLVKCIKVLASRVEQHIG